MIENPMDGDFSMKRCKKLLFLVALALLVNYAAGLFADRHALQTGLVRLHVVANSDEQDDQEIKLKVRDAVVGLLQDSVAELPSAEEAKTYIQSRLGVIERTVNDVLSQAGFPQKAKVTLEKEAFPTRVYDTFSLPAGVYHALRVTIGEGEGQNWWCVLFPSLCVPASAEGFSEVAEVSGFSQDLSHTLTQDDGSHEIRFRLLEWLGSLQNMLFS